MDSQGIRVRNSFQNVDPKYMDEKNYYPNTARREKIYQENLRKERLRQGSRVSVGSGSIKGDMFGHVKP